MGTKYQGTSEEIIALNTFIKLNRASQSVLQRTRTVLDHYHLTEGQFSVLDILYFIGALCQADIARKVLCTTGNMTMLLDNLENRQLIARKRDKADRRYMLVSITQDGKDIIEDLMPKQVELIKREMNILTISEQQELSYLCKKLGRKQKE